MIHVLQTSIEEVPLDFAFAVKDFDGGPSGMIAVGRFPGGKYFLAAAFCGVRRRLIRD